MKLDQFVADTLTQIVKGIKKSQQDLINDNSSNSDQTDINIENGTIVPHYDFYPKDIHISSDRKPIFYVDFDVALTVSNEADAEATVSVMSLLKGSASIKDSNSSVNRIQFNVPIIYPSVNPGTPTE